MKTNDQVKVPELALPKGGGAIHGLNETVQAVGMTGMASLSLPLPVSAGRGFAPSMTLSYSSGSGNGTFGMGWSLALPSIARRLADGVPAYTPEDVFIGPNGEELVPELTAEKEIKTGIVNQYQGHPLHESYKVVRFFPRIEGNFDRIERWTPVDATSSKPCFWLVQGADGSVHLYGKTAAGRIADPTLPNTHIARWLLEESLSPTGEHIYYAYRHENIDDLTKPDKQRDYQANRYLDRVCYGNRKWCKSLYLWDGNTIPSDYWHFSVVFDYGKEPMPVDEQPTFETVRPWARRQDAFSDYAAGFEVRTYRLCRQVLLFHAFDVLGSAPVLVKRMAMRYDETSFLSTLNRVMHFGVGQDENSHDRMPPTLFTYEAFKESEASFDPSRFHPLPTLVGIDDARHYQLIDLYGEGVPGVLYREESGWCYRAPQRNVVKERPDAITYGPWRPLPSAPLGYSHANALYTLTDLTGNGQLDWVMTRPGLAGFFTQRPDKTWSDFTPFAAFPSEFLHPHAQLANLMGAGLSDLALIGPKSVRLYANQREQGFAAPLEVPHTTDDILPLTGSSDQEVVAFSDVLGSGQQHLVRVRHDSVMCWPNLGRGRFGKPISWAIALPIEAEQFNAACVFLADLDGSGAADLIYAQSESLLIFRNQSGNGFDRPEVLPFPEGLRYDALCHLSFADIDGLGCASLILTVPHPEPTHWRYDFSQGRKPYLLTSINNNMGLQVDFTYRSSAQEWLDEKKEHADQSVMSKAPKQSAVSHLPFPVHVVQKITHLDEITKNTLVQKFTYRHGYYDGQEREFRGFGLVTHTDTEQFSAAATLNKDKDEEGTYTAPVRTKTWYHTGVPQDKQARLLYSKQDDKAIQLESEVFTHFDTDASQEVILSKVTLAHMQAEMIRALKGSVLREEVFGLDNPAAGPYTTSESRYLVRCVQDGGTDYRAVVLPLPLETLSYHYERTPTDPVCTQQINLAWDQYGSLTRSVTVHYPRREGASPFEGEFERTWREAPCALQKSCWEASKDDAQKVMWLTETCHAWYHLDTSQAWRLALPYQTRTEAHEIGPDKIPDSVHYENLCNRHLNFFGGNRTLIGHQIYRYDTDDQNSSVTVEGLLKHIETAELDGQALKTYPNLPEPREVGFAKILETIDLTKLFDAPWPSSSEATTEVEQSWKFNIKLLELGIAARNKALKVGGDAKWPTSTVVPHPSGGAVNVKLDDLELAGTYKYLLQIHRTARDKAFEEAGYTELGEDALRPSSETVWAIKQDICTYDTPEKFRRLISHQPTAGAGVTTFTYDQYDCLLTGVEDAMENRSQAYYDYRYLLPIRLVDPNQNRQEAYYDGLGRLVVSSFYSTNEGKHTGGFAQLYEDPPLRMRAVAQSILSVPKYPVDAFDMDQLRPISERDIGKSVSPAISLEPALQDPKKAIGSYAAVYCYDLLNWEKNRSPVQSAVLVSDRYPDDPDPNAKLQVRITLSCSDGFGRTLQVKQKVEAGPAYQRDKNGGLVLNGDKQPVVIDTGTAATRWVASGRVEYNNKGLPVRSYQPYFVNSHLYVNDAAFRLFGYCDTHYYDPLGREVCVVTAEKYLRRQTYHTWCGIKEDENDTLAERLPKIKFNS